MYRRSTKKRGGVITAKVDVTSAMDEFEKGVANAGVLKAASVSAVKKHLRPQIISNYGGSMGGPRKVTGAMSKKSATQVKGLWYKRSKTGVAIAGLKTRNESVHSISPEKAHRIEKWHAALIAGGSEGMYRVSPGITVKNPQGRGTILNTKAWRINDSARYDTKQLKRKTKTVVKVKRNPSRIAHLIEDGHRFPNGQQTKAYKVIQKAVKSRGAATQMAMMKEVKTRAQKAAARAEKKAMQKVADTHNMTRG